MIYFYIFRPSADPFRAQRSLLAGLFPLLAESIKAARHERGAGERESRRLTAGMNVFFFGFYCSRTHALASLVVALFAMGVHVAAVNLIATESVIGCGEGTATASAASTECGATVHHAKQLLALIPMLCSDMVFVVLLGPSPLAMPSWDALLGALFLCSALPHTLRVWATMDLHAAAGGSSETLIGLVQALTTMALFIGGSVLTYTGKVGGWPCLRGVFGLIGAIGLLLCGFLRVSQGGGRSAAYPPLRGSFEGAMVTYCGFIANSLLGLAPSCRYRVHRQLSTFLPDGWLPLSALKTEELQQLLREGEGEQLLREGEGEDCSPCSVVEPLGAVATGWAVASRNGRATGWAGRRPEHAAGGVIDLQTSGASIEKGELEPCGASTLGSCSEIEDLASLAGLAGGGEPLISMAEATTLPVPPRECCSNRALEPKEFSPSFYQRQQALDRTLAASGIHFPDDGMSDGMSDGMEHEDGNGWYGSRYHL